MGFNKGLIIDRYSKIFCHNNLKLLQECYTEAQAIRLYKVNIGYMLRMRYPTKDEANKWFSKQTQIENGIYIDMHFDGERIDDHLCCVFINCTGTIKTGLNKAKTIIPALYLSENSNMEIIVDDEIVYPLRVELYHNSIAKGDKLNIKDYNDKSETDNVMYSDEAHNINPNIINNKDL